MGTRGLLAFHVDGQTKATYTHWDAYPGGLGTDVLEYLHKTPLDEVTAKAKALQKIEQDAPTFEQVAKLSAYLDPHVGGESEVVNWYQLLRKTQGKPDLILEAGYFEDAFDFGTDSLFCEWGFVVDLDAGSFDVYEGFNTTAEPVGLWASQPVYKPEHRPSGEYLPITRVAQFPLSDLPSVEAFLEFLEKDKD